MAKRILLIDDSETDRKLIGDLLRYHGYDVLLAESAEVGLGIARREVPDLVLMDLVLPGMSGFAATKELRCDEATKHIPVIIISTRGKEIDVDWSVRHGACGYIAKPVTGATLRSYIAALW